MFHNRPSAFKYDYKDNAEDIKMCDATGLNQMSLLNIAQRFKLNAEQTLSFLKIGQVFMDEHNKRPTDQLLHFLGGHGGTGKSHVVKAIRFLFDNYKHSNWFAA